MSVVTTEVFGLSDRDTVLVLLSLTLVAIAMSFVWGWLCDRQGPKRTLVWVLAVVGGRARSSAASRSAFGPAGLVPFLVAGAILGSGLGGVQVADRVLMVRLSPPDRIGEFFGIYGLVGKGSQVVGQLLYGLIIFLFLDSFGNGAYQVAVLSLLVTMLIGLWLVWPVRDDWAGSGEWRCRRDGPIARRSASPGRWPSDRADPRGCAGFHPRTRSADRHDPEQRQRALLGLPDSE